MVCSRIMRALYKLRCIHGFLSRLCGRIEATSEFSVMQSMKVKKVLNENNANYEICKQLLELAEHEGLSGGNKFKAISYRKAADVLGQCPTKITSGIQAIQLPGIGKSIAGMIDEFVQTGHIKRLEQVTVVNDGGGGSNGVKTAAAKRQTPNQELAQMFMELAEYEKNVAQEIHKHNAYRRVSNELLALLEPLKSVEEAKQKLEGVGESIATKIEEYLKTGTIKKVEQIRNDENTKVIQEFCRVVGIGPVHAHTLVREGIKSIDDLRQNVDHLNHQQRIGLKHYDDLMQRIPREEMQLMEKLIRKEIKDIDHQFEVELCGSFRRGVSSSGDIDVLITHPDYTSKSAPQKKGDEPKAVSRLMQVIVQRLQRINFITDVLAAGELKFMGICRYKEKKPFRRLDIRIFPKDEYYCAVLYFTGSVLFNTSMRRIAQEQGYTLNEYCLRKVGITGVPGHPLEIKSERDVFDYLGMDYKEPNERNL